MNSTTRRGIDWLKVYVAVSIFTITTVLSAGVAAQAQERTACPPGQEWGNGGCQTISTLDPPLEEQCRYDLEAAGIVDDACAYGRWVRLGKFAGLARCEAGPTPGFPHLAPRGTDAYRLEVRADSKNPRSTARGIFQFINSTWDWVARAHGKTHLVGQDPRNTTIAQQLRQAIRLRNMPGGGISHWVCGYAYGTGSPWIFLTGEWRSASNAPKRCTRNLEGRWNRGTVTAHTVCGYRHEITPAR